MYNMTWRHKDTINDYNNLIAEFQKLYEATSTTNHFVHVRIISEIRKPKRELAKTLAEYDKFKKYKAKLVFVIQKIL